MMTIPPRWLNRWTTATVAALVIGGCGSSPPVRYFSLDPLDATPPTANANTIIVGLGPLHMPQYLSRPQIVTRGVGAEMIVDDFNRWAEPLDRAIHRALAASVDRLLDDATIVAFPYSGIVTVDYRLIGDVERFDVDSSGRATLIAQWGVADTDGTVYVPTGRSRFVSQARSDRPADIVAAMTDTVAQFSRAIAEELQSSLPPRQ